MKIFEEKGYTYKEHLNSGGEGEIHLIKSVDKLFVAKIFPMMDASTFELLENLSKMSIPNIPEIHELFNYEDKTIIIRDYIEGVTLHDYLKENGPLDYIEAKSIILKISTTLKSLHNIKPNPIIYRDLKPENIIITPHKEIRLIDFGIARYYKGENTRDTVLAGTRGYTAPEVLAGMQSDNRSDIYSVGLLFYELLTGKNLLEPPYQIRPVRESNPKLEKWLDVIIEKATDFNQTNRYASIEEFVYYLEHPHKIYYKRRRKFFLIAAAAVFLLAGILFAVSSFVNRSYYYDADDYIEEENQTDENHSNISNNNTPMPNEGTPLGLLQGETRSPQQSILTTEDSPVPSDVYDILLNLEFDTIEDQNYISSVMGPSSQFSFLDGKLFVEKELCSVDFVFERGMTVIYKVRGSEMSSVSIGPYNVMPSGEMDCFYYDEKANIDYGATGLKMQGGATNADNDFVLVIINTPPEGDAVYVSIINGMQDTFNYVSYQVPSHLNDMLYLDMGNVMHMEGGFLHVESITVIEGSPLEFIKNNFSKAYHANQKTINEFYLAAPDSLPMLKLEELPEFWYEP